MSARLRKVTNEILSSNSEVGLPAFVFSQPELDYFAVTVGVNSQLGDRPQWDIILRRTGEQNNLLVGQKNGPKFNWIYAQQDAQGRVRAKNYIVSRQNALNRFILKTINRAELPGITETLKEEDRHFQSPGIHPIIQKSEIVTDTQFSELPTWILEAIKDTSTNISVPATRPVTRN